MREPSIPVSTMATWTPRPVSPARRSAATPSHISGGADGWVGTVWFGERGHDGVGEHADDVGRAVAPQPLERVLAVRLHTHRVGVPWSGGAVVEAARGRRIVPAADAAPHPDRVVGL